MLEKISLWEAWGRVEPLLAFRSSCSFLVFVVRGLVDGRWLWFSSAFFFCAYVRCIDVIDVSFVI